MPFLRGTRQRLSGVLGENVTNFIDDFTGPNTQPINGRRIDSSSRRWVSETGTISGNAARHTETLGAEKITNPTWDVNTTGWTENGGSLLASIAGGQSNNCLEVTTGLDVNSGGYTEITTIVGTVYKLSVYAKSGTSGAQLFQSIVYESPWTNFRLVIEETTTGSWVQHTAYFKATVTNTRIVVWQANFGAGTILFDEISVKPITLSSILTLSNLGFSQGRYWFTPPAAAGELSGIVILANDSVASTDGLFCYVDRTAAKLQVFKRVAGTDTSLISTAITYSAGAKAALVYDASEGKIWAFYNNAIVGTTQALTDASVITNTWHGIMSTGAATVDDVDFGPLGYGAWLTTSGDDITKATPGVVTITAHGLLNGAVVYFDGLTQMTEMNKQYDIVAGKTDNNFQIRSTAAFGAAETTGGAVVRAIQ